MCLLSLVNISVAVLAQSARRSPRALPRRNGPAGVRRVASALPDARAVADGVLYVRRARRVLPGGRVREPCGEDVRREVLR